MLPAGGAIKSVEVAPKEDGNWGLDAIFSPVHSCLSDVLLVIYVQSLPMLGRLDEYKSMYAPVFAGIEFYVDGTWCTPKKNGLPCYGDHLNR